MKVSTALILSYQLATYTSDRADLCAWLPVGRIELPPLPTLVSPFLSLIRSPLTTGPITSHALTAILSLLSLFPAPNPPNEPQDEDLTKALSDISWAVTHCKFEASDSQGDEVVLLKILGVIGKVVEGWGGREGKGGEGVALGDKEVCEMLETGLGMCCQMRLSGELSISFPSFLRFDAPFVIALSSSH